MGEDFTIELLDPFNVILREPEVLGVGVDGGHEGSRVLRVLQSHGMAKLMGSNQEETVP